MSKEISKNLNFAEETLSKTIKIYLEKEKVIDRTERNLLNRLMIFTTIDLRVKDVTEELFEGFLKSLSLNGKTLESYRSRLNRFKRYINVSTSSSHGWRSSKKKEIESLKHELAEKEDIIAKHQRTILRKDAELKKKDEQIAMISSNIGDVENIDELKTKKRELAEQIQRLEHANLYTNEPCPITNDHVLLVKCLECNKQVDCSVIGKHWK